MDVASSAKKAFDEIWLNFPSCNLLLNMFYTCKPLVGKKEKSSFYCCKIVKLQWTTLKKSISKRNI